MTANWFSAFFSCLSTIYYTRNNVPSSHHPAGTALYVCDDGVRIGTHFLSFYIWRTSPLQNASVQTYIVPFEQWKWPSSSSHHFGQKRHTYRNRKRINVAEQIYGQKKKHILKQNYYILDSRHCIFIYTLYTNVVIFSSYVLPNEQVSLDHKIPPRTAVLL